MPSASTVEGAGVEEPGLFSSRPISSRPSSSWESSRRCCRCAGSGSSRCSRQHPVGARDREACDGLMGAPTRRSVRSNRRRPGTRRWGSNFVAEVAACTRSGAASAPEAARSEEVPSKPPEAVWATWDPQAGSRRPGPKLARSALAGRAEWSAQPGRAVGRGARRRAGHANKEIAEALFLSVKTVEGHLDAAPHAKLWVARGHSSPAACPVPGAPPPAPSRKARASLRTLEARTPRPDQPAAGDATMAAARSVTGGPVGRAPELASLDEYLVSQRPRARSC